MSVLFVGVICPRISSISVVASHARDVACESRQRRPDECVCVAAYHLLNHAYVVVVESLAVFLSLVDVVVEELDCEVRISKWMEKTAVLLVRRYVDKARHRLVQKSYRILENLFSRQFHINKLVKKVSPSYVKRKICRKCITVAAVAIHFASTRLFVVEFGWLNRLICEFGSIHMKTAHDLTCRAENLIAVVKSVTHHSLDDVLNFRLC